MNYRDKWKINLRMQLYLSTSPEILRTISTGTRHMFAFPFFLKCRKFQAKKISRYFNKNLKYAAKIALQKVHNKNNTFLAALSSS